MRYAAFRSKLPFVDRKMYMKMPHRRLRNHKRVCYLHWNAVAFGFPGLKANGSPHDESNVP